MLEQEQIQEDGGKLASKYGWDGLSILQICEAALTDANFHHEAEIIALMIEALSKHDQPGFTLVITVSEETGTGDDFEDEDEGDGINGNYTY